MLATSTSANVLDVACTSMPMPMVGGRERAMNDTLGAIMHMVLREL